MSAQRKPKPWTPSTKESIPLPRGPSANESQFADLSELGDIAGYEAHQGTNMTAFLAAVSGLLAVVAIIGGFGYGIGLTLVTVWPRQLAMISENPIMTTLFAVAIGVLSVAACWLRGRAIRKGGK